LEKLGAGAKYPTMANRAGVHKEKKRDRVSVSDNGYYVKCKGGDV
jgi:hypothetical protein